MTISESYKMLLEQAIEIIEHEVLIPNFKTTNKFKEIKNKFAQIKNIEEIKEYLEEEQSNES